MSVIIAQVQEQPEPVECDPEIANPDGELVRQGAIAGSKDAGGACLFPAQPGLVPDRPQLGIADISRFARPNEIAGLKKAVLL